ncbi:MAG: DUF2510 domain-containing protein [Ilumatobacteraceae bacterium]
MKEFVSIKVSSFDHDALATSLTAKSADGWSVVSIVSINSDIVAYLSRETTERSVTGANDSSVGSTEPAGWGAVAASDIASSAPTQMVSTTPASDVPSTAGLDATASTSGTPSVPADWYKDPSGRFEYRYWDGQKWTEHVSRGGTVHKDPPTP